MTETTSSVASTSPPTDVAGVPDAMLRDVLELAVGVAAEGQKLRVPLAIPAGLKPFFKVARLDASGLRSVRRVVAADEGFRGRLGVIDMTGLVDEIGALWLRRPEGWEQAITELVAVAKQRAADDSAAAALRKSEKRREAAEAVAARASAELVGHHDAITRERSRREKAEEAATTATKRAEIVRDENVGLQRENERLRAQLADATQRLEQADAANASLAERLGEVERVRDDLLSRRHPPAASGRPVAETAAAAAAPGSSAVAGPDPAVASAAADLAAALRRADAASAALRAAARATSDLTAALDAAGEALHGSGPTIRRPARDAVDQRRSIAPEPPSPATPQLRDVRPLRPRPRRRQPIPIPGGLYGDSAAAAEHLLRVPDVCVVVDGYNVAKQAWPQLELIDQRECCIELLEDLTRRIGADIRVVFDGADVIGASSRRRLVRVQFSPPGVSADDVIRSDVRSLPIETPTVVVTNDQAIVNDVRAAGVNVISTDTLLAVAGRSPNR